MALMFQRLARNFAKNGYYPTDSETISRIIQAFDFPGNHCNILDPCCGEGTALAEIKHNLLSGSNNIESYGVEYNEERAWHSKEILDHCIHGDLRNCLVGIRQFGLLFLNPPYGDGVSDAAQLNKAESGRLRLEKEFYRRTNGLLQFGGVMVLIVPFYTLDKEFSSWIAKHFSQVKAYMAPEQQFKQCVIFGIRQRGSDQWSGNSQYEQTKDRLTSIGNGDIVADELPVNWNDQTFETMDGDGLYSIPEAIGKPKFESVTLDSKQLSHSLGNSPGLWRQYSSLFSQQKCLDQKRPLCDVSRWHLSLMLAAGQVSGVVEGKNGRTFVVRGNTHKEKKVSVVKTQHKASVEKVTTAKDIFVPVIRGLDMTPGSDTFGEVFSIK